jgi:hypothetical protein
VDQGELVGVVDTPRHRRQQPGRCPGSLPAGEGARADALGKVAALDELQTEVGLSLMDACLQKSDDVWMVEGRIRLGLGTKAG